MRDLDAQIKAYARVLAASEPVTAEECAVDAIGRSGWSSSVLRPPCCWWRE